MPATFEFYEEPGKPLAWEEWRRVGLVCQRNEAAWLMMRINQVARAPDSMAEADVDYYDRAKNICLVQAGDYGLFYFRQLVTGGRAPVHLTLLTCGDLVNQNTRLLIPNPHGLEAEAYRRQKNVLNGGGTYGSQTRP